MIVETMVYKTEPESELHRAVQAAGELLRAGKLVAIPTETVYGLAANALDPEAVNNIFKAKGRPNDNPLIVHIADLSALPDVVSEVPEKARVLMERFWPGPLTIVLPRNPQIPDETTAGLDTVAVRMPSHPVAQAIIRVLMERFWPGPLTIVLPRNPQIPDETTAGLDTVAVRMPSHPVAQAIIRASSLPIAAPSANLSGLPSPTTAEHCIRDLTGKVSAIVDGGPCNFGVESTVITLAGERPRLLRPGAVTLEQLEAAIGSVEVDHAVTGQLQEGQVAASPGMKYKHYSPKALVYLVRGSAEGFRKYVNALPGEGIYAMVFSGEGEGLQKPFREYGAETDHLMQARELFWLLREFDDLGAREIYVRCPSTDGVGLAVYNRLIRAAAFKFIDLD